MTHSEIKIRQYTGSDIDKLAKVYRDSVLELGKGHYDPERLRVWASFSDETGEFGNLLESGYTLVAEATDGPFAFGALNPVDHISLLYTMKGHSRTGVATAIYRELEAHSLSAGIIILRTEASRVSKPFFLKMGFEIVETETALRKGLRFERFKMKKMLSD
ncbi:MAG: GNAT family N-acetyltransferase [Deltaproteobacteria bacterium]